MHLHFYVKNGRYAQTKKYDLVNSVNGRATFLFTQACLPSLLANKQSDVLTISPPLNLETKEFGKCPAYTISKYNMSMVTLALAQAYKRKGYEPIPYGQKQRLPQQLLNICCLSQFIWHRVMPESWPMRLILFLRIQTNIILGIFIWMMMF